MLRKGIILVISVLLIGASFISVTGYIELKDLSSSSVSIVINSDMEETGVSDLCRDFDIWVDDDSGCPGDGSSEWPYCKIQYAIENASSRNSIFVKNGIYYENVVINKSINLNGADRNKTIIKSEEEYHVIYVSSDDVTINNFTVENSSKLDAGICIKSNNNLIKNLILNNNYFGISLEDCNNNNISNNVIKNCFVGIKLKKSSGNIIENNFLENISEEYQGGILLERHAHNNIISKNNLIKTDICVTWSNQNSIYSNNILETNYSITIGNSTGVTISDNNLLDVYYVGISILLCSDIILSDNNIIGGESELDTTGIMMAFSSNININHNTIENFYYATNIESNSGDIDIYCNLIKNNVNGLSVLFCDKMNINKNTIIDNEKSGLFLTTKESEIFKNHIEGNGMGLDLVFGKKNKVNCNNFVDNKEYDGFMALSFFNKFNQNYYSGWKGKYFVLIQGILPAIDWNPVDDEWVIDC